MLNRVGLTTDANYYIEKLLIIVIPASDLLPNCDKASET